MKKIALSQNKFAVVDDDMFDILNKIRWCAHNSGGIFYAIHTFKKEDGGFVYLHHFVIGRPINGKHVDHINGDGLDNRRGNLRIVCNRENQQNSRKHRMGRLPGTVFHNGQWEARISINGKTKYLGGFKAEMDAHKAYKNACAGIKGGGACLIVEDAVAI